MSQVQLTENQNNFELGLEFKCFRTIRIILNLRLKVNLTGEAIVFVATSSAVRRLHDTLHDF